MSIQPIIEALAKDIEQANRANETSIVGICLVILTVAFAACLIIAAFTIAARQKEESK